MTNPRRIWLEPECCSEGERNWSPEYEHWDHDPADEPGHDVPTEYVRADLFADLEAENKILKTGIEEMHVFAEAKPQDKWVMAKCSELLEVSNE